MSTGDTTLGCLTSGGYDESGHVYESARSAARTGIGFASRPANHPQHAAPRLGISTRQVRRIAKRYVSQGLGGLLSQQRGKASNRKLADATRSLAVELIAAHYPDFGPTLAREKLAERHGLHLSVETTRQLMMQS